MASLVSFLRLVVCMVQLPFMQFESLDDVPRKFRFYEWSVRSVGLVRNMKASNGETSSQSWQQRKSGRFQLAMAFFNLSMGVKYFVLSSLGSDQLPWRYRLGDMGLSFGPFSSLFLIVSGYSAILFSAEMFLNWRAWNETGDCWFPVWEQSLVRRSPTAVSNERHRVMLWKGTYLIYVAGMYFSVITFLGCIGQSYYSLLVLTPFREYWPYVLWNTFTLTLSFYWIIGFCCLSTAAFCSSMFQYIVRLKQINYFLHIIGSEVRRVTMRGSVNLSRLQHAVLRSQLHAYEMTRREFQRLSPTWSLIHGLIVLGSSFGLCFWIYLAVYLSASAVMAAVGYSCAACVATYMAVCCLFPSIVAHECKCCLASLHSISCRDQLASIPQVLSAEENSEAQTGNGRKPPRNAQMKRKTRISHHVSRQINRLVALHAKTPLTIQCGALFPVTYHETLRFFCEMVGYYMLFVSVLGIPTQSVIQSLRNGD